MRGVRLAVFGAATALAFLVLSFPSEVGAQDLVPVAEASHFDHLTVILALLALPLLAIVVTSFVKVSIVLAILRSAIGVRGVPPGYVIFALSFVLTAFIMAPVGSEVIERVSTALETGDEPARSEFEQVAAAAEAGSEPIRDFLSAHSDDSDLQLIVSLDAERRSLGTDEIDAGNLLILAPAFLLSELKEAFLIGFLLLLPFLVLDLVIANILTSLGMVMVQPSAVSLPFKLLLFVLVDGWALLVKGLIQSYWVT